MTKCLLKQEYLSNCSGASNQNDTYIVRMHSKIQQTKRTSDGEKRTKKRIRSVNNGKNRKNELIIIHKPPIIYHSSSIHHYHYYRSFINYLPTSFSTINRRLPIKSIIIYHSYIIHNHRYHL